MSVHYHENSAEQMVYVLYAVCDCIVLFIGGVSVTSPFLNLVTLIIRITGFHLEIFDIL